MEKVVFIIGEKHYSRELLSKCLEKYAHATCYHFINKEEMYMYLDLKPSIVIGANDDTIFNETDLIKLKNAMKTMPLIYAIKEDCIEIRTIKSNRLKKSKRFNYNNLYSSLTSLVNHSHSRVNSSMMY